MTSNTVPVYRHGRKFYVSTEEYERIRSEERRQRRTAAQKSQHIPMTKTPQIPIRSPSTSLYTPIQRSQSNPYDYKPGILRTPHVPMNSLLNSTNQRESNRLSRSTLKHYNNQNDLSSLPTGILKKKTPPNSRSNSSDRIIDNQKLPLSSSDNDSDVKRSFSAEIAHLLTSPQPPKSKSPAQSPSRRPVPTIISDYGMSPITTYSMTPNDQTHTQTSPSRLTNYFTRMKKSSLNPPATPLSGPGSVFESNIQGTDHLYTVLGSSNRRLGTKSSSLITRSKSDNSKNDYYHHDTTSDTFSDENSSSLLGLIQRRHTDTTRPRRNEYTTEFDDDYNQQRDIWTRSSNRSQSTDGLLEKKRVRFADTEGLTLETISDRNQLKSPINNRLLIRRQNVKNSNDSRGQPRPFYNAFYQAASKITGSKLATDV